MPFAGACSRSWVLFLIFLESLCCCCMLRDFDQHLKDEDLSFPNPMTCARVAVSIMIVINVIEWVTFSLSTGNGDGAAGDSLHEFEHSNITCLRSLPAAFNTKLCRTTNMSSQSFTPPGVDTAPLLHGAVYLFWCPCE